ncbi:ABC transporter substrate-binding protein [Shimia thalassica]|uniref:heme/hemin ABC transporter substrate-binding protein n=1 Tax=Shimia thalassica TaxID=1715693 RepID=UPI000C08A342|nr:ABC transporter substrate-binding protein [Shimia thalassica]MDO6523506.1 ABC transporter substrate-binding protein [Shimia thalassica]MDP2520280.1 ABC transporter substrate-binding protein [Shimia thalassica]PHO05753.1 hemin ABC transporter substrate-binding protein [Rhodobacteraceae bacterium 4F10]
MTRLSPLSLLQAVMGIIVVLLWVVAARADQAPSRIVSVGGAITEIVYALGEEDRLVARDTTSNYPAAALALPNVGYIRRLSPEGVLSVNPDLILAEEGAGPPEAVELLQEAAVPMIEVAGGYSQQAILDRIRTVADVLDVPDKGEDLAARVKADLAIAVAATEGLDEKRVLFILSMQGGRIMAAGDDTSAQAIIDLAGGENAVSGFVGFKPLTDEAITLSGADVILLMDRTGDHGITNEQLFAHPALGVTPAAQTQSVVRMDGMLMLGFSVRTAQAITDLSQALQAAGS